MVQENFILLLCIKVGGCFGLIFGLNFPTALRPVCIEMMSFHKFLLLNLIFISIFVGGVLVFFWRGVFFRSLKFGSSLDFLEKKKLEVFWTLFPFLILIVIGIYSLHILYHADVASIHPPRRGKKIKVIGRQWYWSYNYLLTMKLKRRKFRSATLNYNSYMINLKEIQNGNFRNLEVDKPLVMNLWSLYSIITTSSDVIHSFSLPTLGIKIDSVPGRLNEMKTMPLISGVYYGQCSELCGVNHSFMPIKVECFRFFKKAYESLNNPRINSRRKK
jgi:heme/copper-type cytochrome/quinol oxidase subunit 2